MVSFNEIHGISVCSAIAIKRLECTDRRIDIVSEIIHHQMFVSVYWLARLQALSDPYCLSTCPLF